MTKPVTILYNAAVDAAGGTVLGSDFGPFEFGGALYISCPVFDIPADNNQHFNIFKSTDGGDTWVSQDRANSPDNADASWYDGNGKFYFVHDPALAGFLVVQTFDCNTDTFGTSSVAGPAFTSSGQPVINVALHALSSGTVVVGYRPAGGGFKIVELVAGVWGSPAVVTASSGALIIGSVLCPGDVVYFQWQILTAFAWHKWNTQWASGAVVGVPQEILPILSEQEFSLNSSTAISISYPGIYSTTMAAMVFAVYNYKPLFGDPDNFELSLLIGTLGSPVVWTLVTGPTAPMPIGFDGDVSPRIAFNSDESKLYISITALSDVGIDSRIILWSSTDSGTSWTSLPDFYNANTDPPDPPPNPLDKLEFPSLKVLADGSIASAMGIGQSDFFASFCGILYYFSESTAVTQSLRLVKSVSGGTALPASWTLTGTGTSQTVTGAGDTGVVVVTDPQTFELTESVGAPGYTAGAWNCGLAVMPTATSVVVSADSSVVCTIINTFSITPPPPPEMCEVFTPTTPTPSFVSYDEPLELQGS